MVHSCVAVLNQGKRRLSWEPSIEVPLLLRFCADRTTTSRLYIDLINMSDKSSENGNIICTMKMRKVGVMSRQLYKYSVTLSPDMLKLPQHRFSFPWKNMIWLHKRGRHFCWPSLPWFKTQHEFNRT